MDSNKTPILEFYSVQGYKLNTSPFTWIFETRDPTPSDVNYPQQKVWLNKSSEKLFVLTSFSSLTGEVEAVWQEVSSSTADINTLTPDIGGAVSPVANNITVQGKASGAFETSNGGAGVLEGAVRVDNSTIFINGSNQLSVNNTGINWLAVNTNQTLADSTGYILQSPGGALQLVLPLTSVVGDTLEIVLDGATSFTIVQNAGQQINYLTFSTTLGALGTVSSTSQGNYIKMVCTVANTTWRILTATGSITLA